jgi:transcriptional regulator with XRE-family HTH domain
MANSKSEFVGRSKVPLRKHPPRNTISVAEALGELKDRPAALGMDELETTSFLLGIELQRARKRLGMSQDELSERSGVPQPRISAIEAGKCANGPTVEIIQRLADALQLQLQLSPYEVSAEKSLSGAFTISNARSVRLADASYDIDIGLSLVDTLTDLDAILSMKAHLMEQKIVPPAFAYNRRAVWGVWHALPHSSAKLKASVPTIVAAIKGDGQVVVQVGQAKITDKVALACPGEVVTVSNNATQSVGFVTLMLDEASLSRILHGTR